MNLKPKYEQLILACDEIEADCAADAMHAFVEYVESVYSEAVILPVLRLRYEGSDLRSRIEALDTDRRNAHNSAINACSILNRLCALKGVECFCPDTEKVDRYAVADFCAEITSEFFSDGTRGDMDSLVGEMLKSRSEQR